MPSKRISLQIHPAFVMLWTFFIFTDGGEYGLCIFTASLIHEVAHIFMFLYYGNTIRHIRLLPFGLDIGLGTVAASSCAEEILCSLAGIFANVISGGVSLAAGISGVILRGDVFALCNFLLAFTNALPIIPLDGGRALYFFLLKRHSPPLAARISSIISFLFLIPLSASGFFLLYKTGYNFSVLIICLYLFAYIGIKKEI